MNMNIAVCNLWNQKPIYQYDFRVDRSSILGNPFYMRDESERDIVCDKYQEYFDERYLKDDKFKNAVLEMVKIYRIYGKLRLFCWCYPKRCHANYIKSVIENIINRNNIL